MTVSVPVLFIGGPADGTLRIVDAAKTGGVLYVPEYNDDGTGPHRRHTYRLMAHAVPTMHFAIHENVRDDEWFKMLVEGYADRHPHKTDIKFMGHDVFISKRERPDENEFAAGRLREYLERAVGFPLEKKERA